MKTIISSFQLSEVVNGLSEQGQLPLGLALMGRSTAIAQTLVDSGSANINAYNADVSKYLKYLIIVFQEQIKLCISGLQFID